MQIFGMELMEIAMVVAFFIAGYVSCWIMSNTKKTQKELNKE